MTLSSPSATCTRAPVASGIRPPLSIIRPALISRSEILCIASISAGVGAAAGFGEVTMYMKRMQNSCWGETRPVRPRDQLAIGMTIQPRPDRHGQQKNCETGRRLLAQHDQGIGGIRDAPPLRIVIGLELPDLAGLRHQDDLAAFEPP